MGLVRRPHGFTLIDLMIVVSLITILSAVGIPNMVRSREQARLQSCSASLRSVMTASVMYTTDNGGAEVLATVWPTSGYVDSKLNPGTQGYARLSQYTAPNSMMCPAASVTNENRWYRMVQMFDDGEKGHVEVRCQNEERGFHPWLPAGYPRLSSDRMEAELGP